MIKIEYVPAPGMGEIELMAPQQRLIAHLKTVDFIEVNVTDNTKTTASVEILGPRMCFFWNPVIEPFKFLVAGKTNMFEGNRVIQGYFKFSKHQHYGVFEEYLKKSIEHYLVTRKIIEPGGDYTIKLQQGWKLANYKKAFPVPDNWRPESAPLKALTLDL